MPNRKSASRTSTSGFPGRRPAMRIKRAMTIGASVVAFAAVTAGALVVHLRRTEVAFAAEKHGGAARSPVLELRAMPLGLPTPETAKAVLDASLPKHHPQWLEVPMGATKIRAFVLYPDVPGKAPVAVITAGNQGLSDWARAVGTQV